MKSPQLFRKEISEKKHDSALDGETLVIQPASFKVYALLIFFLIALLLLFVFFARISTTERAIGHLEPESGFINVYAPSVGFIKEMFVREGGLVANGDPLFSVSSAQAGNNNVEHYDSLVNNFEATKEKIIQTVEYNKQSFQISYSNLKDENHQLQAQIELLERRLELSEELTLIAFEEEEAYQPLLDSGHISEQLSKEKRRLHIEAQTRTFELRQQLTSLRRSLRSNENELLLLSNEHASEIRNLENYLLEIERDEIDLNARLGYKILAPTNGLVTNLLFENGDYTGSNMPVLSILPEDSPLVGILYIPTRARGFLEVGQEVNIQYQAYPYQQFGAHKGLVISISNAPIQPYNLDFSLPIQEPVYKIKVKLPSQDFLAFGEYKSLEVGMLIDADIAVSRRTIMNWLLEPIYSVRGYF